MEIKLKMSKQIKTLVAFKRKNWPPCHLEKYSTRMHCSRIRTARCSDHLSCHAHPCYACPPAMHAPPCHAHPLLCTPATHAPLWHTSPAMHVPLPCMPPATPAPLPCTTPCHTPRYTPPATPPLDRILDTHLWKHYLSAATVEDGKN